MFFFIAGRFWLAGDVVWDTENPHRNGPRNNQGNPIAAPPQSGAPPRNKGLIFGLIKGNQWVFISPDHKGPRLFLGGNVALGGSPLGFPLNNGNSRVHPVVGFFVSDLQWSVLMFCVGRRVSASFFGMLDAKLTFKRFWKVLMFGRNMIKFKLLFNCLFHG